MKIVMVTGASGFLGRAVLREAPSGVEILACVHSEEGYLAVQGSQHVIPWFVDVRDKEGILDAMARNHVDTVIHLAAMKHVPYGEQFPDEMIETNVQGTVNVIEAAYRLDAHVVAMSSDKAVVPTSVYGATKAVLERLCVARGFVAVRSGNIIGSTGSALPLWRQQAAQGEPLTVTDRAMTRFYIAGGAVADLLWRSCDLQGGSIVVPRLRACSVGRLADAISTVQQVIGPRPGERTHELLLQPEDLVVDLGWAYAIQPDGTPYGMDYRSDRFDSLPVEEILG